MRTQTQREEQIKIALAIYRGLPDKERADRFEIALTNLQSEHPDIRRFASDILPVYERAEIEIRMERERLSVLEREVQFVRQQLAQTAGHGQPDIYGGQERSDIRRGAFGVGTLLVCVGGVCWLFFQAGPGIVFGSLAAIGLLKLAFGGSGGKSEGDYVPATEQAQPSQGIRTGQTIIFNVSQNGDVNYTQQ